MSIEGYRFYKNLDSFGYDINYIPNKSVEELKNICDGDERCVAFNTLGFIKNNVVGEERDYINIGRGVLYVKERKYRVKLLCNWKSCKDICEEMSKMTMGNNMWNDIEITWEDTDIDFYVILNMPGNNKYIPERSIVFQLEPWCYEEYQKWGVKTWGEWSKPDEKKFLEVRTHRKYYNPSIWLYGLTYREIKNMVIDKEKGKIISSVCSSKYFDVGHIKRINFLKFVESKKDDVVKIDIYNEDNNHNFVNYMGPHPKNKKDVGLIPYKYYFMAENNQEHNFITEKIWECILTETLCFYWGCPNVSEYIDPRAYIVLNLDDFEGSFRIIKESILNNEWEKRIQYIRREKMKVLDYYGFFPTLERIIKKKYRFPYKPSDDMIRSCKEKYGDLYFE